MKTLEEEIIGLMRRLNAISRRQTKREAPEEDAGPEKRNHGKGRLVALLMDNGPMVQSQLAEQLGIRPQSLSELLGKVEADGLVSRRHSEEDKRQTIVSLTEKGRANVETFRCAHRQHAEEFLVPLNDEEKQQLAGILRKLMEARKEKAE